MFIVSTPPGLCLERNSLDQLLCPASSANQSSLFTTEPRLSQECRESLLGACSNFLDAAEWKPDMPLLPTIFETCRPRADVAAGTTKDEQFAADLAQVVNGTAPKEYLDSALFFRHSYPTRGMRELLKAVLTRLSGRGGEIASIIRLDTRYGGGKTHGLFVMTGAVRFAFLPTVAMDGFSATTSRRCCPYSMTELLP